METILAVLMLSPCFTDNCIATQSRPVENVPPMAIAECRELARDMNRTNAIAWAWCMVPAADA